MPADPLPDQTGRVDSYVVWMIVALVVVAAIGGGIWFYLRQRWIQSLRAKGWFFEGSPGIQEVFGLNVPPFGLGENRRVSDLIVGQLPSGVEFRSVSYKNDVAGQQVVLVRLPRPLPELHVATPGMPAGVAWPPLEGFGAQVHSPLPEYARALAPGMAAAIGPAPTGTWLTIDGDRLVSARAPRDAEELAAHLAVVDAAYRAVVGAPLDAWPAPMVPQGLSIYLHPDWDYAERDDSALDLVIHDRGGDDHKAESVIRGVVGGFPWVALRHEWTTTSTSTDSEGRTRTTTHHHTEHIMEVAAPQGFPDFSVNKFSLFRQRSEFESIDFNRDFKVRCTDPRFAHDVVHPRMMEYVQATYPAFEIEHGRFRHLDYSGHIGQIERNVAFVEGFLARIPRFVWKNLGYADVPLELQD